VRVEPQARGAKAVFLAVKRNAGWLLLLFVGVLLPLLVFVQLADEVHECEKLAFDNPILLNAYGLSGPGLDQFFVVVAKLGYEGVIALEIMIVLVLLAFRRWREASFAALSFTGSALLNLGAKQLFQRERPTLWASISPEQTFSFPSAHAMGSMTLAMVVVLLAWPTRWRWLVTLVAMVFVLLVGYSRIYLGVHYPSDILAGWMAAIAWVMGGYLLVFRVPLRPWAGVSAPPR